jgi:hypothetical protein
MLSQYRNLLHSYTHQHGEAHTCGFWTGCGAIRTAVFRAHGGFDEAHERPCIEDVELGTRLRQAGRQVWLDKGLQVKHLKHLRFWAVVKTDVWDRAIPWTRLILRSHQMPADLGLRWGQRFSVLASGWAAAALVLSVVFAPGGEARWAAALAVSAAVAAFFVAAINWDFYRFLARVRSPWFALRAFPLHCIYFLCGGTGFAAGLVAHECDVWRRRFFPPKHPADKPIAANPPAPVSSCSAAPPNV